MQILVDHFFVVAPPDVWHSLAGLLDPVVWFRQVWVTNLSSEPPETEARSFPSSNWSLSYFWMVGDFLKPTDYANIPTYTHILPLCLFPSFPLSPALFLIFCPFLIAFWMEALWRTDGRLDWIQGQNRFSFLNHTIHVLCMKIWKWSLVS